MTEGHEATGRGTTMGDPLQRSDLHLGGTESLQGKSLDDDAPQALAPDVGGGGTP